MKRFFAMLDARDLPHGQVIRSHVCIVGAGAAGIAMALDFIGTKINVLVLESGGLKPDAATQDLYRGAVADERLHSPPDRYRLRCLGGSTAIWGGRCVPFDRIDFKQRPYIPHSGWPFDYDDLIPYYQRAAQLCDTGAFAYTAEEALAAGSRPMLYGLDHRVFTQNTLERFSLPTHFGVRYSEQLRAAPNVCVLLHANLSALNLNPEGTAVDSAMARTLTGKTLQVCAEHFIFATGGLETARLLLASRSVHRNGVGNDRDQVGRYYMCHLAGTAGRFTPARADAVWHGYDRSAEGVYCRRRLALSAAAQKRWQIGNFIARLHHPRIAEPSHRTGALSLLYFAKPFISYEYGKRLHDDAPGLAGFMRHMGNILSDPLDTSSFLLHWMKYRTLAARKFPSIIVKPKANAYSLDFHAEQLPNPDSRVTLDSEVDALGMPRIRIDWRYLPADVETVTRSFSLLAAEIAHSGVGTLEYDPQELEQEMVRYGAYGGHHIGTARIGTDPHHSVADTNCRVHGVANLFVAGAATFPTSSQANPTLTVVAMALRLAAYVKQLSAQGPSVLSISSIAAEPAPPRDRTQVANAA
jgi:choline dehydrogenase-like flavoprotein